MGARHGQRKGKRRTISQYKRGFAQLDLLRNVRPVPSKSSVIAIAAARAQIVPTETRQWVLLQLLTLEFSHVNASIDRKVEIILSP